MENDFGKKYRLHLSHDIKAVCSSGLKTVHFPFVVYRLPNNLGPRMAVAVTRKAGNSVVRNRYKRKLRELFRLHKKVLGNYDFFFYTSRPLKTISNDKWSLFERAFLNWSEK